MSSPDDERGARPRRQRRLRPASTEPPPRRPRRPAGNRRRVGDEGAAEPELTPPENARAKAGRNRRTRAPEDAPRNPASGEPPRVDHGEEVHEVAAPVRFPGKRSPRADFDSFPEIDEDGLDEGSLDDADEVEALDSVRPPSVARERLGAFVARVRWVLRWTLRLALAAALGAGVYFGGTELHRFVRSADAFAIQEIEIEGLERLERDALLEVAGIRPGVNVFERDPEEVRAALLAQPWIAEAEVQRRLPGSFRVQVVEHHPVALLEFAPVELGDVRGPQTGNTDASGSEATPDGVDSALNAERRFLIADDARLFKVYEEGVDPDDLPAVRGVDRLRFASDRAYRRALLGEIVALFDAWRAAGLWRREPPREIEVSSDRRFTALAGEAEPIRVALGFAPHRQKLRRLRRLLDRTDPMDLRPEYVLLDNVRRPDRVTVRFHEVPEPVAPEDPAEPR